MESIVIPVVLVTAIGLLCAVILSVASKIMAVKTDERAVQIREVLPGANCGACGYPGCDGYAAALAGGGVKTNLCIPGGDKVSKQISDILGVAFEDVVERVAVVRCSGDRNATGDKMNYDGIQTCAAAKLFFGGKGACPYGCLGFGDCANACPQGAICIENGLARVDARACNGCGICASVCPSRIIALEPATIRQVIRCSSREKGAVTRKACSKGCIACGRCQRECPVQAITVTNNLAVTDYSKCDGCGRCAAVCPVGCIEMVSYAKAPVAAI